MQGSNCKQRRYRTAVSGGTAIISARTVDGDYEAHCTVTVAVEAEIADITATNGVLTVT